jgi:hypothetical protein
MDDDQSGRCDECVKTKDRVIRRIILPSFPRLCDACFEERKGAPRVRA